MKLRLKRLLAAALCALGTLVVLIVGGLAALMLFGRGAPPEAVPAGDTPLGQKYQEVLSQREALASQVKALQDSLANIDVSLHSAGVAAYKANELEAAGEKSDSEKLAAEAAEGLRQIQRQLALQRSVMKDALKEAKAVPKTAGSDLASSGVEPRQETQVSGAEKKEPPLSDLFK